MTPSELRLISCPYHNGLRGVGMGEGAARLANDAELRAGLEELGWQVACVEVEPVDESDPEIARVIELVRRVAAEVRRAVAERAFPLVLAGNCNSSLGTVAGVGEGLAVVWFDAHADFDDPDENTSGFFDVMGLAMLTGRGWPGLRATIPGHQPVPESNVLLAGVRDLEPYQKRRLEGSGIRSVPGDIDPEHFDRALLGIRSSASQVYLHVDLDSLDASVATANKYAAPGGPDLERLLDCIRRVCDHFEVGAAAITAYDPSFDRDSRTLQSARRVACEIGARARQGCAPGE
jgi:arginase